MEFFDFVIWWRFVSSLCYPCRCRLIFFSFFVSSNWKKNDSFEMATGFVGEIMNFSMGSQSNRDDGG